MLFFTNRYSIDSDVDNFFSNNMEIFPFMSAISSVEGKQKFCQLIKSQP